jgi:hypothetical protein
MTRQRQDRADEVDVNHDEGRLRRERERFRCAGRPASSSRPIGLEPDEGRAGSLGRGWLRRFCPDRASDHDADYRSNREFDRIHHRALGIPLLDALFEGHLNEVRCT